MPHYWTDETRRAFCGRECLRAACDEGRAPKLARMVRTERAPNPRETSSADGAYTPLRCAVCGTVVPKVGAL